jgi:hypothetical protein
MLRKAAFALLLAALITAGSACQGEKKPAGTPIEDLIAAGQPPVTVGTLVKGLSPIAPTFTMSLTNVSSSPISAVGGTIIFFDADGKALPDTIKDAGYADVTPIEPGGTVELQIMSSSEKAVSGKWILKDALYEKPNPMGKEYGTLPYKWTNAGYAAALEAERAK